MAFQVFWPATGNVRLYRRLTGGTRNRLLPVERSDRLPGRLCTTVYCEMCTDTSGPRYGGALGSEELNVHRHLIIILS